MVSASISGPIFANLCFSICLFKFAAISKIDISFDSECLTLK